MLKRNKISLSIFLSFVSQENNEKIQFLVVFLWTNVSITNFRSDEASFQKLTFVTMKN